MLRIPPCLSVCLCLCLLATLVSSSGCGSTSGSISSDLLSVQWRATTMAGKAPSSTNEITLLVDSDGSVAGQAPVNRYAAQGVVSATGGWSFENPSTTKRLGTPEEMDEESLFMRLVIRANRWDKHGSKLDLLEGKRVLMTFTRDRK